MPHLKPMSVSFNVLLRREAPAILAGLKTM
ncbi:hypothetical protein ALON55S_08221 [Alishewanella longhuensis]